MPATVAIPAPAVGPSLCTASSAQNQIGARLGIYPVGCCGLNADIWPSKLRCLVLLGGSGDRHLVEAGDWHGRFMNPRPRPPGGGFFAQTMAVEVSNPKALLFFGAFFLQFIHRSQRERRPFRSSSWGSPPWRWQRSPTRWWCSLPPVSPRGSAQAAPASCAGPAAACWSPAASGWRSEGSGGGLLHAVTASLFGLYLAPTGYPATAFGARTR